MTRAACLSKSIRSVVLNTPNVVAQCCGCLDRAGSARYRPNGRP